MMRHKRLRPKRLTERVHPHRRVITAIPANGPQYYRVSFRIDDYRVTAEH